MYICIASVQHLAKPRRGHPPSWRWSLRAASKHGRKCISHPGLAYCRTTLSAAEWQTAETKESSNQYLIIYTYIYIYILSRKAPKNLALGQASLWRRGTLSTWIRTSKSTCRLGKQDLLERGDLRLSLLDTRTLRSFPFTSSTLAWEPLRSLC